MGDVRQQPKSQVLLDHGQGEKQFATETENWQRISGAVGRRAEITMGYGTLLGSSSIRCSISVAFIRIGVVRGSN